MAKTLLKRLFRGIIESKLALALPVTFLILFVSTLGIISVTYYLSVERIYSQSETFKVSTAKQNFVSLDNVILSTLWHPGSASTFHLTDSDGSINIQPTNNVLNISINDNSGVNKNIFNASIGQATYELPYSRSSETGLYLKGDSRTITNQSGSSIDQICIVNGAQHSEIQLRYRPTVSYATGGLENGRSVNNIRLYLVNLNSSDPIAAQGEVQLKITCTSAQLTTETFQVSNQFESIIITSQLDGINGSVSIPISSTSAGSVIYIETVISNVSIQRLII